MINNDNQDNDIQYATIFTEPENNFFCKVSPNSSFFDHELFDELKSENCKCSYNNILTHPEEESAYLHVIYHKSEEDSSDTPTDLI
jgi:hypothetical protein